MQQCKDGVAAQCLDPWEPRHGTNLGLRDATGGAWGRDLWNTYLITSGREGGDDIEYESGSIGAKKISVCKS